MKKIILSSLILGLIIATAGVVIAGKVETKIKNGEIAGQCTTIQDGTLFASDGSEITIGFDDWGYNYQGRLFNGLYCDSYRDAEWCQEYKDVKLSMKWNDAWLSNKDCDGDDTLDRHYGYDSYIGSGAWLTNHQSGEYESEIYNWDVSGDWVLDFAGGIDNREFRDLVQDAEGNVVGEFWYFSGTWLYGGILEGTVTGDSLHLDYDRAPILYKGVFDGTIGDNEITAGTFSDSHGNNLLWTATGASVKVYETCDWNYFIKIIAAPADAHTEDGTWYSADDVEIGPIIWGEFAIIQKVENDKCAGLNGMQYVSPAGAGLGQYKEKVTFIHYADGRHEQIGESKLTKKAKPVRDDGCYSFISKDMEWWTQPAYTISVDLEGEYSVSQDQFEQAVEASISEWNSPILSDTSFIGFGAQTVDSDQATGIVNDEVNTISFGDYDRDGVIAVCSVWGYYGGPPAKRQITEFDVMLDTDYAWGVGDEEKMDLQNILTHELGHAVGLGDLYTTECDTQTMYGFSTEGDIEKRTLESGDIAGLNILY